MFGVGALTRRAYSQLSIRRRSKFLGSAADPIGDAIGEAVETEAKRIKRAVRALLAGRNLPPEVLDRLDRAIDSASCCARPWGRRR